MTDPTHNKSLPLRRSSPNPQTESLSPSFDFQPRQPVIETVFFRCAVKGCVDPHFSRR